MVRRCAAASALRPTRPMAPGCRPAAVTAANVGQSLLCQGRYQQAGSSARAGQLRVHARQRRGREHGAVGARRCRAHSASGDAAGCMRDQQYRAGDAHDVIRAVGDVEQELVEYGFRRGVSYNLLGMNPGGTTAVSYQVNPLDFPNTSQNASALEPRDACVHSFATGPLRRAACGPIRRVYVSETVHARPDRANSTPASTTIPVRAATAARRRRTAISGHTTSGMDSWWMNSPVSIRASAQPNVANGKLLTIADQSVAVAGTTRASYGPLWAFSKPVRFSATAPDGVGTPFLAADWPVLYPVASGTQLASSFDDDDPSPYTGNAPAHRINAAGAGEQAQDPSYSLAGMPGLGRDGQCAGTRPVPDDSTCCSCNNDSRCGAGRGPCRVWRAW